MIRERLQNREKLQILKLLRHGIRAIREQSPPEAPSEAAAEVKTQDNDQDDAAKIMLDSSEIREKRNSVLGGEGVAVAEIIASVRCSGSFRDSLGLYQCATAVCSGDQQWVRSAWQARKNLWVGPEAYGP